MKFYLTILCIFTFALSVSAQKKNHRSTDEGKPANSQPAPTPTPPIYDDLFDIIEDASIYFREGKAIIGSFRSEALGKFRIALEIAQRANVSDEDKPKLAEFIQKLIEDINNAKALPEPEALPTPKPEPVKTPDVPEQMPVVIERSTPVEPFNTCITSESPLIQGLRLDTSLAEIKASSWLNFKTARLSKTTPDTFIFIKPNKDVNVLALNFYKNRLMSIGVAYADSIKWDSLQEFRNKIAESLNISGYWSADTGYYSSISAKTSISCTNFTLQLQKDLKDYSLILTSKIVLNRKTKDAIEAWKKQKILNEKKKATFKP